MIYSKKLDTEIGKSHINQTLDWSISRGAEHYHKSTVVRCASVYICPPCSMSI